MNSGVLQTHTATEQWQTFEIRMRRRRVERCVLRASVAIEAGVLEDARAALEEVQRLDPYEPALETLRTQLTSAETNIPSAGLLAAESRDCCSIDRWRVPPRHSRSRSAGAPRGTATPPCVALRGGGPAAGDDLRSRGLVLGDHEHARTADQRADRRRRTGNARSASRTSSRVARLRGAAQRERGGRALLHRTGHPRDDCDRDHRYTGTQTGSRFRARRSVVGPRSNAGCVIARRQYAIDLRHHGAARGSYRTSASSCGAARACSPTRGAVAGTSGGCRR